MTGVLGMTGIGAARGESEIGVVAVEVRTLNGRNFSSKLRVPTELAGCEADLEGLLRAKIRRGNVLATIELATAIGASSALDVEFATSVTTELRQLAQRLGLVGAITLAEVLAVPGVVRARDAVRAKVSTPLPPRVRDLVERALEDLLGHRREEGLATARGMRADLARIEQEAASVQARWPQIVAEHRARLLARLNEFLATKAVALEPKDILREVALFADKADVGEELQRLGTHVEKARALLDQGGEVGRTLDFLLQELLREANTLGAKVPDTQVAHAVVEIKLAVERLKEQAQNLE